MRRLSLLLVAGVLGWVAWALVTLPPESAGLRVPVPQPGDPAVVRGAYHVHSVASDGTGTAEEDFIEHLFIASTHDNLLLFTSRGKVFAIKVQVPQPLDPDKRVFKSGMAAEVFLPLSND